MYEFFTSKEIKLSILISILFYVISSIAITSVCFSSAEEYGIRWKKSFNFNTENFDQFHEDMSIREKSITEHLQGNDKDRCILLASIRIIYKDENGSRKTVISEIPNGNKVFISGTKEPVDNTEIFIAPTKNEYLTKVITGRMEAFEKLPVEYLNILSSEILKNMKDRVDIINQSSDINNQYKGARDDTITYGDSLSFNRKNTNGDWITPTDKQLIDEISKVRICLLSLNSYHFLVSESKEIVSKLEGLQQNLLRLQQAKNRTNAMILALKGCADAEQHLMAYLSQHIDEIVIPENNKVELIALHIHSRFDVCQFCAPSLWIELNVSDGVLATLQKKCSEGENKPPIAIFVSCRQELKGAKRRDVGKQDFEEIINLQDVSKYVYQKITTHQ